MLGCTLLLATLILSFSILLSSLGIQRNDDCDLGGSMRPTTVETQILPFGL